MSMIDAIVGSVVIVIATTALALAVEVGQKALTAAGRYPLTSSERQMLLTAGRSDQESLRLLQQDLEGMPLQ